jgi:AbiV family abortive infection protein
MTLTVTAQSLLRGAFYSLEQCGRLLGDAKLLYENSSYATTLAVVAFAGEELGRWHRLRERRERVLRGERLTVEAVRAACNNHIRKQEAGVVLREDEDPEVAKLLQKRSQASLGSKARIKGDKQVDEIVQQELEDAPRERHEERMQALYVDILSEEEWNQPAREISQTKAYKRLVDTRNGYEVQRQRYIELLLVKSLDPELHDALAQWPDRPELPQVEAFPSYPVAGEGSIRASEHASTAIA